MSHRRGRRFRGAVGSIAVAGCLAVLPGCSLFVGSMQPVTITSSDPLAEILVDGQYVGQGAVSTELRRNRSHAVMARVGDRVGTTTIETKISTLGILDLIGGVFFLIPFIGVAGPGFLELDPPNVNVVLPPERPQA